MTSFSHLLHSPFLALLPLAVMAWYGWKLARTPAPVFAAAVPLGPLPLAAARRAYYRQAKGITPGLVEYLQWFHTLPAAQRPAARLAGLAGTWKERPFRKSFRRYVLEHRGYRYVDFMAGHLDAAQFGRWMSLLELAAPEQAHRPIVSRPG